MYAIDTIEAIVFERLFDLYVFVYVCVIVKSLTIKIVVKYRVHDNGKVLKIQVESIAVCHIHKKHSKI